MPDEKAPKIHLTMKKGGINKFNILKKKIKLNKFFNSNEVIFYKNSNDLAESINYLKDNDKKRREIGRNGRIKYHKYFNNQIVTSFIIEKTFNLKFSKNYVWI